MQQPKKIVVIGPESTGKSTLCEQLAMHYKTNWVKEYAREYLLKNGTEYNFDDLLTIAKGQLESEDAMVNDKRLMINEESSTLFIDTDMYVMKVWCEFVFDKCHRWILDQIAERKYDLYLLCNVDLPWIKDELREYPDLESRQKLYHIYKDIVINQQVPWVDISGNYDERLKKAIICVDKIVWSH
jgi:NadR type nicotinamide-nucleotide adenylyltransferase